MEYFIFLGAVFIVVISLAILGIISSQKRYAAEKMFEKSFEELKKNVAKLEKLIDDL